MAYVAPSLRFARKFDGYFPELLSAVHSPHLTSFSTFRFRLFSLVSQTANAYIVKENQTLNKELRAVETKVGQLLVENSKLKIESVKLRRDLLMSVQREDSWKERVGELHEENVQLRHFAGKGTSSSFNSLRHAKNSAGSLVASLSGVFGGGYDDSPRRPGPTPCNRLSSSNSYGLKRAVSSPISMAMTRPLSSSSNRTWGNTSMPATASSGNSTWTKPNVAAGPSSAVAGDEDRTGADMFLAILESGRAA